ncbi:MAG: RiPP maturation radical SAM protein 1, partial [Nitrospirales bacterium]|nr:RiPP maturation radical SAM protein 1 [Nitrospirales bacterium]
KALSYLTVFDGRHHTPRSERFEGGLAFIIEFCNDQPKTFEQIRKGLQEATVSSSEKIQPLADMLTLLKGKRFIHEEGGRFFTLALPVNPYR